jgi:hypothetical protein
LSELLDTVEREPLQDEVHVVRLLFELFGFLLSLQGLKPNLVYDNNAALKRRSSTSLHAVVFLRVFE